MPRKYRGSFVDIQIDPRDLKNFRLAQQLPKRTDAMLRALPYEAAQMLLSSVVSGLPNRGQYREIKKNLEVAEVSVFRKGVGGHGAFALHVPTKSRRVKKTDASRTVLYVRVKDKRLVVDPAVMVLEDMGPWTMDTIPFWPDKRKASVVQRKVSVREVQKVAKRQRAQKNKVRRDLNRLGKRIPAKRKLKLKRGKAVPDLVMSALELEFGMTGGSKPVWRQSLAKLRKGGVRRIERNRQVRQIWYDGNSKIYKTWPKRGKSISSGDAAKYRGFQKRLGYG